MKNILFWFLIAIIAVCGFGQHTYSIVAVDSVTGEIGSAGATCLDTTLLPPGEEGALVISDIILGKGAIHSQAYWYPPNQNAARLRMEMGDSPQEIINWLVENDNGGDGANITYRQYGIVDLNNGHPRSAAYTGSNNSHVAHHILGPNYAIQGNILLEQAVVEDMEAAFNKTQGTLADKLMAAMQGAKRIGADSRCRDDGVSCLSAFLRVAQSSDSISDYGKLSLDLNISATPDFVDPIDKLQEAYDQWLIKKFNYAHTTKISLSSTYASPGTDTVTITAIVKNPLQHEVSVYGKITMGDSLFADSVSLYNDGLHNDGSASDSIWTLLIDPLLAEKIFRVSLTTTDLTAGISFNLVNALQFTTIGPLQTAEPAYIDTNYNDGLNMHFILLALQNKGSIATAEDLSVSVDSDDPRIEMGVSNRLYPDIDAGDVYPGNTLRYFSFSYAEGFHPDSTIEKPVLFDVTVLSRNIPFWTSSFYFTAHKGITVGIVEKEGSLAKEYSLHQNYPNPFNPKTNIEYSVRAIHESPQLINLSIYNLLGQKVATLVDKKHAAGRYSVEWDAMDFASGIYIYTLETSSGFKHSRKLVLLK